ncbi:MULTISPECIES: GntR family transcriptional regulator [Bacillaceae]|uniref:GntR family transcriptional regulator n=1 Tax=Bacillaceae TaxID=186817 RepID=UPI000C765A39|nr:MULTISPECIES: GntR family transcriptional regulator [Bacillaceae]PLR69207.1 GntR family transcriptional regulator [Bacillus sp. UMB0893]QNG59326.1 GntR family transcriptional regulator [Bacillus sp. PAMC26568]
MFDLDPRNRKPIYEQLVERFVELIISEVLSVDEQLPSVRTLAQQLTINPNTIQRAYRELESLGYIYSIKGKGSFVSLSSERSKLEKLNSVMAELERLVAEAISLGMTVDELQQFIFTINQISGGGHSSDSPK